MDWRRYTVVYIITIIIAIDNFIYIIVIIICAL